MINSSANGLPRQSSAILVNPVEDHVHILHRFSHGFHPGSVIAYIRDQLDNHRSKSFQDEFRDFLKKNKLAFDEIHLRN